MCHDVGETYLVDSYAAQTAQLGNSVTTVDTLDMIAVTVVVALVFMQVPSIAGGLASGVGLATYGARADAVVKALVKRGVAKVRLSSHGYGQEKPVADNSTEPGRAKNRRVELVEME